MMHIDDDILDDKGMIDPNKIRLVGRMGGDHYCEAFGSAVFDVKKPLSTLGIGVDQLPDHIRLSDVLTGNDLGQLANIEKLPDEKSIQNAMLMAGKKSEDELHAMAKSLIAEGRPEEALALLMSIVH
jgi:hypothetical protein